MDKEKVLKAMATMIAGIQAPYSIDPRMVGAAGPAYVELSRELHLRGWVTAEDAELALREALL